MQKLTYGVVAFGLILGLSKNGYSDSDKKIDYFEIGTEQVQSVLDSFEFDSNGHYDADDQISGDHPIWQALRSGVVLIGVQGVQNGRPLSGRGSGFFLKDDPSELHTALHVLAVAIQKKGEDFIVPFLSVVFPTPFGMGSERLLDVRIKYIDPVNDYAILDLKGLKSIEAMIAPLERAGRRPYLGETLYATGYPGGVRRPVSFKKSDGKGNWSSVEKTLYTGNSTLSVTQGISAPFHKYYFKDSDEVVSSLKKYLSNSENYIENADGELVTLTPRISDYDPKAFGQKADGIIETPSAMQTTAMVYPGISGGPILNSEFKVIGVAHKLVKGEGRHLGSPYVDFETVSVTRKAFYTLAEMILGLP